MKLKVSRVLPDGCVDLRQLAGNRYRLKHEHKPHLRAEDDPWLVIIPCERGHLYPHSANLIGYASDTGGQRVRNVAALRGALVLQEGSDGTNVVVPVRSWARLVELVKPRRRRQVSAVERERLAELSCKHSPYRNREFADVRTAPSLACRKS